MTLTAQQEKQYEELRRVKEEIEDQYIGKNGVIGVGVGFKIKRGKQTGDLTIRFYVEKKGRVPAARALPKSIKGHPTDVIEFAPKPGLIVPPARKAQVGAGPDTKRYNPLVGGISVAPSRFDNYAGTLGLIVKDTKTGDLMMLSNYHVMCGDDGKCKVGDEMCQEARFDNAIGWCGNCAELTRWQAGNVTINNVEYGVDAAVAVKTARNATLGGIADAGTITGTAPAAVGMKVFKRGRTSELTQGEVDDIAYSGQEDFGPPIGKVVMKNQVRVVGDKGDFSKGGDSGAVYVDKASKCVVGLNWGSHPATKAAVGNPIAAVVQALNITITGDKSDS